MDSNKHPHDSRARWGAAAAIGAALVLAGCSVAGPRESPVNAITKDSPTVLQVYEGQVNANDAARKATPRQKLRDGSGARPVAAGDGDTARYWSALQPMRQRFARVPNPDLVMVVYPHLANGKYPVPGYVTVFPMYEQTQYALPGEVERDLMSENAIAGATAARMDTGTARGAAMQRMGTPDGFEN